MGCSLKRECAVRVAGGGVLSLHEGTVPCYTRPTPPLTR